MEKLRKLKIRAFHIKEVRFGAKTSIKDGVLELSTAKVEEIREKVGLLKELKVSIIKPHEHDIEINTIMDIIPISTKVLGRLGEGISHTLTGVYAMVTGKDEDDRQIAAFGSSDGILSEQMKLGKAGTPGEEDYIIHIDCLIEGAPPFDRQLPNACMRASDLILQEIRDFLKKMEAKEADEEHEYFDVKRAGKKRVLMIKLVAGQGACYDNKLFNNEPSGFEGGRSIIDLGNMPILLTPNEYRDGAIRSLT